MKKTIGLTTFVSLSLASMIALAPAANAAQIAHGTIKAFDLTGDNNSHKTITLSDGRTFVLPKAYTNGKLKTGETVDVVFDTFLNADHAFSVMIVK